MKQKVEVKDKPYLYLDSSLFEGELSEVAKKVLNIKNMLQDAHRARELSVQKEHRKDMIPTFTPFEQYEEIKLDTCYDNDGINIEVKVFRLETDDEVKIREKKAKERSEKAKLAAQKRKEAVEKRELTLLETLKKKYENKSTRENT